RHKLCGGSSADGNGQVRSFELLQCLPLGEARSAWGQPNLLHFVFLDADQSPRPFQVPTNDRCRSKFVAFLRAGPRISQTFSTHLLGFARGSACSNSVLSRSKFSSLEKHILISDLVAVQNFRLFCRILSISSAPLSSLQSSLQSLLVQNRIDYLYLYMDIRLC
ncbi:unnamed protein product, partial [Linum tenue]